MNYQEHYNDYKWVKVKRYSMDESKSWEERYRDLEIHHINETNFMVDEVRSLAKELDANQAELKTYRDHEWWKERVSTFMVMWGGFSISIALLINLFMDKQQGNGLFPIVLGAGGILSGLFCWYKYAYSKRL